MSVKPLCIDKIRCDGGTQMRAELSVDVYMDYRDKILAGVEFPPLDVFYDGSEYWLADGFHRFYGHREAKKASVKCVVHNGTVRDAILFAAGANDAHGLQRSRDDKRNAINTLLDDKEWGKRSSNWIAQQCKVSHNTVEACRKDRLSIDNPKQEPEKRTGKDGKAQSAKKKQPASVTGTGTNPPSASPPSLPSVGTVNQTETGSQGDGDAGECIKGGGHTFEDGACSKCLEPDDSAIPPVVPIDPNGFDHANIEAHNESFAANFAARVKAHNLEIERFARSIMEAFADPPESVWLDDSRLGIAQDQIKSACATIRQAKVHDKPCPKCDGKGSHTGKACKWCKGAGFMPERSYEMAGGQ
jgi:hypothetical protein